MRQCDDQRRRRRQEGGGVSIWLEREEKESALLVQPPSSQVRHTRVTVRRERVRGIQNSSAGPWCVPATEINL